MYLSRKCTQSRLRGSIWLRKTPWEVGKGRNWLNNFEFLPVKAGCLLYHCVFIMTTANRRHRSFSGNIRNNSIISELYRVSKKLPTSHEVFWPNNTFSSITNLKEITSDSRSFAIAIGMGDLEKGWSSHINKELFYSLIICNI